MLHFKPALLYKENSVQRSVSKTKLMFNQNLHTLLICLCDPFHGLDIFLQALLIKQSAVIFPDLVCSFRLPVCVNACTHAYCICSM